MLHGLIKLSTKGIQKSENQTLMEKNSSMRSESEFGLVWNHANDNVVPCQLSYIKYTKDFKIC